MKTVRFEIIDGVQVVTGFDQLQKDPVETKRSVQAAMRETDEHQAMADVEHRLQAEYERLRTELKKQYPKSTGYGVKLESPELTALWAEHDIVRDAFVKRLDKCIDANAVYFELRAGECTVDDRDALQAKFKALGPHERLAVDGQTLVDFRGVDYYQQGTEGWKQYCWDKFGEPLPEGAVQPSDMTEAQRNDVQRDAEVQRIRSLSAPERNAEKQARLSAAAAQAAQHRSIQEIKGASTADALTDAQSLHTMLVEEINQLYT
ncbi:MAG: hypothetical protein ACYTBJ_20200 [Planctomycetota bacterium]